MRRGDRLAIAKATHDALHASNEAWQVVREPRNLAKVTEVFSPPRVAPVAASLGLQQGKSYDILLGHDMLDSRIRQIVRKELAVERPDLLVITPPCDAFSILQQLNDHKHSDNMTYRHKRRVALQQARILLNFAVELARDQMQRGGKFLFEHPRSASSWVEPALLELAMHPAVYTVHADLCCFGFRSPHPENLPTKKPTRFATNCAGVAAMLNKQCNNKHKHVSLQSSIAGISRTAHAAVWTRELCKAIVRGFQRGSWESHAWHCECADSLQQREKQKSSRQQAYAVDLEEEAAGETGETGERREEYLESEESDQETVIDQQKARTIRDPMLKSLYKLHTNMGHPSNADLCRFLRQGGAHESAIQACKHLYCSVCERRKQPKLQRPAALHPPRSFNDIVGVDCFQTRHWESGKTQTCLNIVCWATGLQQVCPVPGESPPALRAAYRSNWVLPFGRPGVIVCDQHGSFKGLFSQRGRLDGSRIYRISTEAPWQNGRTEKKGGDWKMAFEATLSEMNPGDEEEYRECIIQTTLAMNEMSRRKGYSPNQLVFGKNPILPGNILEMFPEADLHIHSQAESVDKLHARALEIRTAARVHVIKIENNRKMRRALLAASRPERGPFVAGTCGPQQEKGQGSRLL